jgi:hypothetical protein
MNQNSVVVKLRDFTSSDRPFGNIEGKEVFRRLADLLEQNPRTKIFGVSLDGIEATDASFPRESVISVAKHFRGERGVYLTDLHDRDLIDNWNYAARFKEQPLVIWSASAFQIIGPELNAATRTLVEYVLGKGSVLASQAAADLGLSVQNASTRLKNLVAAGYILRAEEVAESGGIEFKYQAIH